MEGDQVDERAWMMRMTRYFVLPKDEDELARIMAEVERFHAEFPDTPERFATHEAGHAVVAHALGWYVEYVDPKMPDGRGAGAMTWQPGLEPSTFPEQWARFREQAVVAVAGCVAEEIAFGGGIPLEAMEVCEQARARFGRTDDQLRDLIDAAEARAREILTARWDAVRRLSEAQADGRVGGERLEALLTGA